MIDFVGGVFIGGVGGGIGIFCLISMISGLDCSTVSKKPWLGGFVVIGGLGGFLASVLISAWFTSGYIEQHFAIELAVPRVSSPSSYTPTFGTILGVIGGLCLCAPVVFILVSWIVDFIIDPNASLRDLRSKLQSRAPTVHESKSGYGTQSPVGKRRHRGKKL